MIKHFILAASCFALVFPHQAIADQSITTAEDYAAQRAHGSTLFWGALTLLNATLLTSSMIDLRFYNDRADELEAVGDDASPYWDASGREKIMVGLSAISFVFSLAGLKRSFAEPTPIDRFAMNQGRSVQPVPAISPSGSPGDVLSDEIVSSLFGGEEVGVEILSLEGRIRYDTLFTSADDLMAMMESKTSDLEEVIAATVPAEPETEIPIELPAEVDEINWPVVDPLGSVELAELETWNHSDGENEERAVPLLTDRLEEVVLLAEPDPIEDVILHLPADTTDEQITDEADATAELEQTPAAEEISVVVLEAPAEEMDVEMPATHADPIVTAPPRPIVPEPTFALNRFAVHVASFSTLDQAEVDFARWVKRGSQVTIEERDLGDRGIWYRILVGNFDDYDRASDEAVKLADQYGIEYTLAVRRTGF